jgi:hypothetical protein
MELAEVPEQCGMTVQGPYFGERNEFENRKLRKICIHVQCKQAVRQP